MMHSVMRVRNTTLFVAAESHGPFSTGIHLPSAFQPSAAANAIGRKLCVPPHRFVKV